MNRVILLPACLLAALALVTPETAFGSILQPDGLPPGARYRLVFTTAGLTDATSRDINYYNNFVNAQARVRGSVVQNLNVGWSAIVSVRGINARDNTSTRPSQFGVPIYLVDGSTKIADNYPDLWDGTIDGTISRDQFLRRTSGSTWTGTDQNGLRYVGFDNADWSLGSRPAITGGPNSTGDDWIQQALVGHIEGVGSIYAISGTLIAIPEPTALALAAMLTGWGMMGRCRVA